MTCLNLQIFPTAFNEQVSCVSGGDKVNCFEDARRFLRALMLPDNKAWTATSGYTVTSLATRSLRGHAFEGVLL